MQRSEIEEIVLEPGLGGYARFAELAQVWVYFHGTTIQAPVYGQEGDLVPVTQPLTVNPGGHIDGWVEDNFYDFRVVATDGRSTVQPWRSTSGPPGGDTGVISMLKRRNGVVANGTADDGQAMQAVIDASPVGAVIFWPAHHEDGTPAIYGTARWLKLKPGRSYLGGGWAKAVSGGGAIIKQLTGANITAPGNVAGLLVPEGWVANQSLCDGPIRVENLALDLNKGGNGASTACGIVVCNFWSKVAENYVKDAPGDGILLSDVTANGSTQITNTASENTVSANKLVNSGVCGIRQRCANNNSNLDGFCRDNLIDGVGRSAIEFQRGAGWVVARNHTYGRTPVNAIDLDNCFATVVAENYVEQFGDLGGAGAFSNGLRINVLAGRGAHVVDNSVSCQETDDTVAAYQYVSVNAAFGAQAQAVVRGNIALGPTSKTSVKGVGLQLGSRGGGGRLRVARGGNVVTQVKLEADIGADAELWREDTSGRMRATANVLVAPAVFKDPGMGTGAPNPTNTGNDVAGTISFGTGTALPGPSSTVGITFAREYAVPPTVMLTPLNAASAALSFWALPHEWGFGIGCGGLALNQGASVYQFAYEVVG